LDAVCALRGRSPRVAPASVRLYGPAPATRSVDQGVVVRYYLKQPAKELELEFLDANGQVIRSFAYEPRDSARAGGAQGGGRFGGGQARVRNEAGLNRFVWDMRYPGATDFPGMILWAAGTRGPRAVPGSYQVRLVADGRTLTEPFGIRKDPRLTAVTQADLEEQFRFAMQIPERTSDANEAVLLIRGVKSQIDDRVGKANDERIASAGEAFKAALTEVEGEIYQYRNRSNQDPLNYPIKLNNKIAALLNIVDGADSRPTDQSYTVFEE